MTKMHTVLIKEQNRAEHPRRVRLDKLNKPRKYFAKRRACCASLEYEVLPRKEGIRAAVRIFLSYRLDESLFIVEYCHLTRHPKRVLLTAAIRKNTG